MWIKGGKAGQGGKGGKVVQGEAVIKEGEGEDENVDKGSERGGEERKKRRGKGDGWSELRREENGVCRRNSEKEGE